MGDVRMKDTGLKDQEQEEACNSKALQPSWAKQQSSFSKALQDPMSDLPQTISSLKGGITANKRFNVYRNNIALSLINVLRETFPVVNELVGENFFHTMARHFSAANLPTSPVMFEYGSTFPDFVTSYEPTSDLPFLPDVARLEWMRNQAYYSQDAEILSIDHLSQFQEDEIPNLIFKFHPSLQLLQSEWPIVSIWQAHQTETPENNLKDLPATGESALVLRPHLDITLRKLAPATYKFIDMLHRGANFAEAVEAGAKLDDDFDIPANLAGLFSTGAVISVCN